jgi:Caleosin related protein
MNSLEPVLQQRYAFFDAEKGGVVTFLNFNKLSFDILLFTLAVFIIHANFFCMPSVPIA